MVSRMLKAAAVASLVLGGSAAVAQSAQPLSLEMARAGAGMEGAGALRGRVHAYALGLALIAILVFVLVEATDNNDETEPASP